MTTSDHVTAAARHLADLLRHGQDDLTTRADVRSAAHARDQVATDLARALDAVLAQLATVAGQEAAVDAGVPIITGLTRRMTRVPAPPSGRVRADRQVPRSVQTWAAAAAEVQWAAAQVDRAGPAATRDLRAAAADLAALAGALAVLDPGLAAALQGVGLTRAGSVLAGHHMARGHLERLYRDAQTVIGLLDSTDLPAGYDLPAPVKGVAAVTDVRAVPAAIHRAAVMLDRTRTVSSVQHAAVAMETARLAHQLRNLLRADPTDPTKLPQRVETDDALRRFVQAHLGLVHVWQTTQRLRCRPGGSWEPAAQLRAVNQLLATASAGPPLDTALLQDAASRLPAVADAAAAQFERSLSRRTWTAAYQDRDGAVAWATLWPDYGPASRGQTPDVAEVGPLLAHLPGHAVHENWHDRNLPVEGYRLGDAIEDRRVGSPGGVADLNRVFTALDATQATGRGLRAATDAPHAHATTPAPDAASDAAPARRTLVMGQSARPAGEQIVQVRRSSHLPAALRHAASLLGVAAPLTISDVRQIARIVAEVAHDGSRALQRAGHDTQATALAQHARLLTTFSQTTPRAPTRTGNRTPALAQLQQVRHHLAVLRTAGIDLTPSLAQAAGQLLPDLTVAFADAAQMIITGARRELLVNRRETAELRRLFPERPLAVTPGAATVPDPRLDVLRRPRACPSPAQPSRPMPPSRPR